VYNNIFKQELAKKGKLVASCEDEIYGLLESEWAKPTYDLKANWNTLTTNLASGGAKLNGCGNKPYNPEYAKIFEKAHKCADEIRGIAAQSWATADYNLAGEWDGLSRKGFISNCTNNNIGFKPVYNNILKKELATKLQSQTAKTSKLQEVLDRSGSMVQEQIGKLKGEFNSMKTSEKHNVRWTNKNSPVYVYTYANITINGLTMRYLYREFYGARNLLIVLHGGGQTTGEENNKAWDDMTWLYNSIMQEKGGVIVAPRMPKDLWNGWFIPEIDAFLNKIISCMVAEFSVDPNRVYLLGYSAGGDGVYRLGPRMADKWAGVAMYAGHPGATTPENLRNVFFLGRVGEYDDEFKSKETGHKVNLNLNRPKLVLEYGQKIQALKVGNDASSYNYSTEIKSGFEHGDVPSAEGVRKIMDYTRNPYPDTVVWKQSGSGDDQIITKHMYWLYIENPTDGQFIRATHSASNKQSFTIEEVRNLSSITIKLNQEMCDLKQKIEVTHKGSIIYNDFATTDDKFIANEFERFDPKMFFVAKVTVKFS
jgi:hypothetical protein